MQQEIKEQSGDAWLAWRNEGLGSSDIPVIMGVSKYMTPFQLWEIKTGKKKPEPGNTFVQDLGHRWEPVARSDFELTYDIECPPICVQHAEFDFLRASLDGYNEDENIFIEIKYVGAARIQWVRDNQSVLPDHEPQTDHQFMITGAERAYYICYTLSKCRKFLDEIETVCIYPDKDRIENIIMPKVFEFWECVKADTPPDFNDRDYKRFKKEGKK